MKLHLIGLPHTKTTPGFQTCAYTQKVWKLTYMLPKQGFEVIHYGTEGADVGCEHVTVLDNEQWTRDYGSRKPTDFYDLADTPSTAIFYQNTIKAIRERATPNEIILFPFGQREVGRGLPNFPLQVESGVGYTGVFAPFQIFESYTWMHHIYGIQQNENGRWFDAVIPNYFDPDAFYTGDSEGYFLYLGRVTYRKGVTIAVDVCNKLGKTLVIAGQGNLADAGILNTKHVVFVGPTNDPKMRAKLLAHAIAVFCPTIYIEPFCGVAVEAMMSGVPVLTSNFGAFTETVIHGKTGWRCQMFDDFVWGVKHLDHFDPTFIRNYAVANYSYDHCGQMYKEYFNRLISINEEAGWYKEYPNKQNLDWLLKEEVKCV
jgi:glycosyltransferase involved in cell wall biosynthesis